MQNKLIDSKLGVLNFSMLIKHMIQKFDGLCEIQLGIVNKIVEECPALNAPITDLTKIKEYMPHIERLFFLFFPTIFWESHELAILLPGSMVPIHASPKFKAAFLNESGQFDMAPSFDPKKFTKNRLSRMYMHVFEQAYGIKTNATVEDNFIFPSIDKKTGLERYYFMDVDMRFVEVISKQKLKPMSENDIKEIKRNITDPERLKSKISIEQFEISGITIVRAADVTRTHVLSMIQNDLIDKDNISTKDGFYRLQKRLQNYFQRPGLIANLACFYDDQVLMLNMGCDLSNSCIISSSRQISRSYFTDTPFEEAVKKKDIFVFRDILKHDSCVMSQKAMEDGNIRSFMICPLMYRDECIGILNIADPEPEIFGAQAMIKVEAIRPLFAMAINRAMEDLDNEVQGIIKEKCTAVHPSVEWKFRKATLQYISDSISDEQAELAPIIFKNVYPLYGIADVRGSTNARNNAIQKDLDDHLKYARNVIELVAKERDMLIFEQLLERIEEERSRIKQSLASGDELSIVRFIQKDIEGIFAHVRQFSPEISRAVDVYESHIDKQLGTVYKLRKEFEESILLLNQRLANFLDTEQNSIQEVFPHFYERHRTDGVDYLIYIGKSMNEKGLFHDIYVNNLHLWQIHIACGMAWLTQYLKSELSVPLDIAHLILVQNSPLSIRFRYDEKQFDVDGAYDIRHEIIKSRIDKAVVKGTGERLTQPQKIAIVYSMQEEETEMLQHIRYLQKQEVLKKKIEFIDLEDLPGVTGLKALRVGIVLNSTFLSKWMAHYWSKIHS